MREVRIRLISCQMLVVEGIRIQTIRQILMMMAALVASPTFGGSNAIEELTVTGSRVVRDGFAAPTPVTVVNAAELRAAEPQSLSAAVIELPQFSNSLTRSTNANVSDPQGQHGAYLNLRGLGTNRLLVLMDGRRLPPSSPAGEVNVALLPEMLVRRVEVVTGGASAVYGSDAISGVVNYVLDTEFQGVKGNAQYGVSTDDDGEHYRLGLAAGRRLNERLHALASVAYFDARGIRRGDRPLQEPLYAFVPQVPRSPWGTVDNPLVIKRDVLSGQPNSAVGVVDAGPPGVVGMTFGSQGEIVPFNPGLPTGLPTTRIGGSGAGPLTLGTHLITPQETLQTFAQISYDFSHRVRGTLNVMYGESWNDTDMSGSGVQRARIYSGNPFLPTEFQSVLNRDTPGELIDRDGNEYILYTRTMDEGKPNIGDESASYLTMTAGLSGAFGDGWGYDGYFSIGRSKLDTRFTGVNNQRLFAGLDAVSDPATGRTVCNVNLIRPAWYTGGCVPIDVFGPGSVTAEMVDWYRTFIITDVDNDQNNAGLTVTGSSLSNWAGPVEVAFGGEWRENELTMTSNSDPNFPPDMTGIRFDGSARNSAPFFNGNRTPANGKVNVKEAFAEVMVPLARDAPFAHALDVSAAARVTDYSTSGGVTTWKVGGSWEPFTGLRLRGTYSEDIRAPSLFELYASRTLGGGGRVFDPHCGGCQGPNPPAIFTGGNPDLEPEEADTVTVGVIYRPRWLPQLNISLDYYDIDIAGVIGTRSAIEIMVACEDSNGTADACDLVDRPLPFADRTVNNYPNAISTINENLSFLSTAGVDLEARYDLDLTSLGLDGDLQLRALVNWVDHRTTRAADPGAQAEDRAGVVGGLLGSFGSIPDLQGRFSATYVRGRFRMHGIARVIGGQTIDAALLPTDEVFDPDHVDAEWYLSTTVGYTVPLQASEVEIFLSVRNLLNNDPPLVPPPYLVVGLTYPTDQSLYDVMGRYFTAGIRVSL